MSQGSDPWNGGTDWRSAQVGW